MRIVVTGGGSGGHTTPLLAVASELKKNRPNVEIVYIGQKGDRFASVVAEHSSIDDVKFIYAGKLRRYHGEGLRQLLDIKTMLLNMRDFFLVILGIIQSVWLLKKMQPQVIFIKGGFVGVPVGLAAALWRIPYVTHDSDALAGLANRIIAKWARTHAVALPTEQYNYPAEKTVTVGVPIAAEYQYVTTDLQGAYKKQLDLPVESKVLLVTGGGLGARLINVSVAAIAHVLLGNHKDLHIVHTTGHAHFSSVKKLYEETVPSSMMDRVHLIDYTSELYLYSGAADVVLARSGATNMAELAAQAKATVIVPNPILAGGHQVKNAEAYTKANAALVIQETELKKDTAYLQKTLETLLSDEALRTEVATNLHNFAHKHSAEELTQVLLLAAEQGDAKVGL